MFKESKNSSSCLDDGVYESGNIYVRQLVVVVGAALLLSPLLASVGHAASVPLDMTFTGTVLDTSHDVVSDSPGPPLFADVVDGQARGTFGASRIVAVTEFVFSGVGVGPCAGTDDWYLTVAYSKAVITFKDGDQLFSSFDESGDGGLCLNVMTGDYHGSIDYMIEGGTGQFEDASGGYEVPFSGRNLTFPDGLPFGFGSIDGAGIGTVELQ